MSSVISLAGYKCAPGAMAMHAIHGMVEVVGQEGWMRCVLVESRRAIPPESQDELFAECIHTVEEWVHVSELTEANLVKDIENLRKRGQLLHNAMD